MPWYAKRSVYRIDDNVTRRPCPCSHSAPHPDPARKSERVAAVTSVSAA